MVEKFLSEDEKIQGTEKTILDYWRWGHSSILDNTSRGIYAEFLVGSALDALEQPRVEWDNADIQYKGYTIEVKSSAFIQSWKQFTPSKPVFGIAPKYAWTGVGNEYEKEKRRFADIFISFVYSKKKVERK
ncbi:hypothetical protein ACXYMX_14000 [Sporosarcina sp. CAU 1771]